MYLYKQFFKEDVKCELLYGLGGRGSNGTLQKVTLIDSIPGYLDLVVGYYFLLLRIFPVVNQLNY